MTRSEFPSKEQSKHQFYLLRTTLVLNFTVLKNSQLLSVRLEIYNNLCGFRQTSRKRESIDSCRSRPHRGYSGGVPVWLRARATGGAGRSGGGHARAHGAGRKGRRARAREAVRSAGGAAHPRGALPAPGCCPRRFDWSSRRIALGAILKRRGGGTAGLAAEGEGGEEAIGCGGGGGSRRAAERSSESATRR